MACAFCTNRPVKNPIICHFKKYLMQLLLRELIHLPIWWPSLTSGFQIFLQMELKGFLFLFEILLYNFRLIRFWPLPNLQLSSHQNGKGILIWMLRSCEHISTHPRSPLSQTTAEWGRGTESKQHMTSLHSQTGSVYSETAELQECGRWSPLQPRLEAEILWSVLTSEYNAEAK